MRAGARGGWINGSLTWNGLDSWQLRERGVPADHLELVRELSRFPASAGTTSYYYSYGAERTLDLSDCAALSSGRCWTRRPASGQARPRAGELGEVPLPQGELRIDVTRGRSEARPAGSGLASGRRHSTARRADLRRCCSSAKRARLRLRRVAPSGRDRTENERLRLVRLARPAPPKLQKMVLDGELLDDPRERVRPFRRGALPGAAQRCNGGLLGRLVHAARDLPARARAARALRRATRRRAAWEWAYRIGRRRGTAACGKRGPGVPRPRRRACDPRRHRLTGTGLERFGLIDGRAAADRARSPAHRARQHAARRPRGCRRWPGGPT